MTDPRDALTLVDWRRRVAELYADVRSLVDPAEGHALWRAGRDDLFRNHPQSPLPADDPLRDTGLPYWPYDPSLRFEAELVADVDDAGLELERVFDAGNDGPLTMQRVGHVVLPLSEPATLAVWWLHQYGGGFFVPLRDGTSGADGGSYGAGRYLLDTAKGSWLGGGAGSGGEGPGGGAGSGGEGPGGGAGSIVLDLNFAYHPSCRYDWRWTCPLAPPANTIPHAIEAGERL